jgi:four helix bundle protein
MPHRICESPKLLTVRSTGAGTAYVGLAANGDICEEGVVAVKEIKSFRDLEVWREAIELVVECYRLTQSFPQSERYGLVAQLRKCATSIPANIAEGHGRRSRRAYLNHINVALGSEAEFATHVHVSVRLGFCTDEQVRQLSDHRERVGRMLNALATSLKRQFIQRAVVAVGSLGMLGLWLA